MKEEGKLLACLGRKLLLLDKISANTEVQSRFVRRREMRGLGRLLRERAALIEELAAVNREIEDQGLEGLKTAAAVAQAAAVAAKEREVLAACRRVLEEAVAERSQIAAELNSLRRRRQLQKQYDPPWAGIAAAQGIRLNEKV